jgi:MscS family membrane protein
MQYSDFNQWLEANIGENTLIFELFMAVFVTLLVNFIWRRVYLRLDRQLKKTKNTWDDAVLMALSSPVSVLIWGIGSWIIFNYLLQVAVQSEIRDVFIVSVVAWSMVRFIRLAEENLIEASKTATNQDRVDKSTIEAISKLLRVSVSITTFLLILQNLGVSISAVLAFGGIGGIAIGFAAKDLLANFFGGLIIYLDRPFAVGDWIRSNDRDIEGTVEYIGWRQTRIRTFDKRPLYVPNAVFNSITVENPSRMTNRRIYETFGVRYDDISQVENIVQQVKSMLEGRSDIDNRQTLIVNLNQFNESSVDFFVYTFTKTTDWVKFHQIKQQVLLAIAKIVESNQSELAYPTQRLQLEDLRVQTQAE